MVRFVIKRAYEEPTPSDGFRVLVDRVWPRGMTKEALRLDLWERELAPSGTLRTWFGHDPERWQGFCERYRRELSAPERYQRMCTLIEAARGNWIVTLVYGAKDRLHNQAVVLRNALEDLEAKRGK
ncbi:MAG TPA: DUF488 family protein [Candidatus Dormibacteraeota bacterium]|nr:DUF488 family protein [Candidatus Dormibacteraeota bacterium]